MSDMSVGRIHRTVRFVLGRTSMTACISGAVERTEDVKWHCALNPTPLEVRI